MSKILGMDGKPAANEEVKEETAAEVAQDAAQEENQSNPITDANREAAEAKLPFAECRRCENFAFCPIPNMSHTNLNIPDPHKCWLETMRKDPNAKGFIAKMLGQAQNRYGLTVLELDGLEKTIELLQRTMDNTSRISVHGKGALGAVDRHFKGRR